MSESKLLPATKARPCPVCGGDHKCSSTADGLILCGRTTGAAPGFRHLGPCEKNPVWHLYRSADDPGPNRSGPERERGSDAPPRSRSGSDGGSDPSHPHPRPTGAVLPSLARLAEGFAAHLTPDRAADLARRLGLPASAVGFLEVGFDPRENCWTFPERDPAGPVVGILRRFPDGAKRAYPGHGRGLSLPGGWADAPGPVFLVEGPTDALALSACGLSAVGRPSSRGGGEMLGTLLSRLDPARPVVVVGENDAKPGGAWPGKEGAKELAAELAGRLGRAVLCTLPPPEYKDVREWVVDRYAGSGEGFDWGDLGRDVSRDLVSHAVTFDPPVSAKGGAVARLNGVALAARRYPVPTPVTEFQAPGSGGGYQWVWEGFLGRDAVTLLSAHPKCGKTTLLTHLLSALPAGGEFCGRALAPGRAVVVSEEPRGVWAARAKALGLTADVRVIPRGCLPRAASADDWEGFVTHLAGVLEADPADLVVFDTLANLWPVRDENSSAEVGAALAPLHRLCAGRSVLLVHHLRKSDGGEGTGSRGSGALTAFVDVILELRRRKEAVDPGQRKRVLRGLGRDDAIPAEWVVELTPTGDGRLRYVHLPEGDEKEASAGAARADRLRAAIQTVLYQYGAGTGLSRREIWEALPDGERRNEPKFREVLEGGVGRDWAKEDRATARGGPIYRPGGEN